MKYPSKYTWNQKAREMKLCEKIKQIQGSHLKLRTDTVLDI